MPHDKNTVLSDKEISLLMENASKDPFAFLGMHSEDKGLSIRTIQHGAVKIEIRNRENSKLLGEMTPIEDTPIFTIKFPRRKNHFKYSLIITYENGFQQETADPYVQGGHPNASVDVIPGGDQRSS